jgi:alpha 1,2-mannosyltransferase
LQDNLPLSDPALLFDSIEYQQSGSVFWPDLNKDHREWMWPSELHLLPSIIWSLSTATHAPAADNAIFRILGRDCSDEHWPAEAGQIVFDKRGNNGLNLAVLHLSNHMMANEEMYGFLSYGDKDTFVSGIEIGFSDTNTPSSPRLFLTS